MAKKPNNSDTRIEEPTYWSKVLFKTVKHKP